MKVVEKILTATKRFIDFCLAAIGGAIIMAVVAFMGYSFIDMIANPISIQEEQCFMSVQVFQCVREHCPEVGWCSIEEYETVEKKCHNECVAQ